MEVAKFVSPVALVGSLLGGKKQAAPASTPVPTRNDAAEAAEKRDLVSKRRGVAANMILGAGGAESSAGAKSALGA